VAQLHLNDKAGTRHSGARARSTIKNDGDAGAHDNQRHEHQGSRAQEISHTLTSFALRPAVEGSFAESD
jgi:hypothetical protein